MVGFFAKKALAFPVGLCQDCAGQRSRVINRWVFLIPKKTHRFTVDSRLVFPLKLLLDFKRDGSRNPPKEFHRWWFRKGREVTRTLTALSFLPWKMCMI